MVAHGRGEAMPIEKLKDELVPSRSRTESPEIRQPRWYAIWTRSNCEQKVFELLSKKGFDAFLPYLDEWGTRRGVRYICNKPMFPGYIFLSHAMDKWSYIDVCNTDGVARVLGAGWNQLISIPKHEIDAIQAVQLAGVPRMPYSFLKEGQRVRVTNGALMNVVGILVKQDPVKGVLVLSVDLLHKSIAVKVDCTDVAPA
jgi:transcription termination/antitermination protein NusG